MVADDSFRTVGKGIDRVGAAISFATGVSVVVGWGLSMRGRRSTDFPTGPGGTLRYAVVG